MLPYNKKPLFIFLLTNLFCFFLTPLPLHADVVKHITDGDTFTTTKGEKIRLYGVNSPEMNTSQGEDAKVYMQNLLPPGSNVTLIRMYKDPHKRTIAIVIHQDKIINELLVKSGHAHIMSRYCKIQACKEWKK